MAHNAGAYIDGNRGLVYRTVNGLGTNLDPHTNVIAPHDEFSYIAGGYKAFNVEPQRYVQYNITYTISVGNQVLANLDSSGIDCRKLKFLSLKIVSTGVALNDYIIGVGLDGGVAIWDEIANSDFHYTTGQGENTGNPMVLVRKASPQNPRTLPANGATWILLNVEPYAALYSRVNATSAGTLKIYYYGLYN
jgi:hypothetical protein